MIPIVNCPLQEKLSAQMEQFTGVAALQSTLPCTYQVWLTRMHSYCTGSKAVASQMTMACLLHNTCSIQLLQRQELHNL